MKERLSVFIGDIPIFETTSARVPLEVLTGRRSARSNEHTHAHDHPFVTETIDLPKGLLLAELNERLENLPPSTLRAKGFVETAEGARLVQLVGKRVTITKARGVTCDNLLVVIGVGV